MKKYTEEEMSEMDYCSGVVCSEECPFGDMPDSYLGGSGGLSPRECFDNHTKGLKIDSIVIDELPSNPFEDKPFTLESLAYAIQNRLKIRDQSWEPHQFIIPSKDMKGWVDEVGDTFNPFFGDCSMWQFYKEPPKTEEVKFYRPIVYNEDTGVIDPFQYFKKSKDDFELEPQFIVVKWEVETFQIPVGAKLCTPKKKC